MRTDKTLFEQIVDKNTNLGRQMRAVVDRGLKSDNIEEGLKTISIMGALESTYERKRKNLMMMADIGDTIEALDAAVMENKRLEE